jgi:hypothetical protein
MSDTAHDKPSPGLNANDFLHLALDCVNALVTFCDKIGTTIDDFEFSGYRSAST